MSAKELTFFLPEQLNKNQLLSDLVEGLGLDVIEIPNDLELEYQFLARRGEGKSILEMEFSDNARAIIEELADWENPITEYKNDLLICCSVINLSYRDTSNAREFIELLFQKLSELSGPCIVDNGEGCLLRLAEIAKCLEQYEDWSWERREFPELPNVAASEWSDME